jgi:hypothetical protein
LQHPAENGLAGSRMLLSCVKFNCTFTSKRKLLFSLFLFCCRENSRSQELKEPEFDCTHPFLSPAKKAALINFKVFLSPQ